MGFVYITLFKQKLILVLRKMLIHLACYFTFSVTSEDEEVKERGNVEKERE